MQNRHIPLDIMCIWIKKGMPTTSIGTSRDYPQFWPSHGVQFVEEQKEFE